MMLFSVWKTRKGMEKRLTDRIGPIRWEIERIAVLGQQRAGEGPIVRRGEDFQAHETVIGGFVHDNVGREGDLGSNGRVVHRNIERVSIRIVCDGISEQR